MKCFELLRRIEMLSKRAESMKRTLQRQAKLTEEARRKRIDEVMSLPIAFRVGSTMLYRLEGEDGYWHLTSNDTCTRAYSPYMRCVRFYRKLSQKEVLSHITDHCCVDELPF